MTQLFTLSETQKTAIRDRLFAGLTPMAQLRLYVMAGIPGAGKTTFVAQARASGLFPDPAFTLNPDAVMDLIDAYHADHAALGPVEAFARWEMPARDIAYALAHEAAANRFPIIKDMGMARAENWQMLEDFKAQGYAVELHAIHCNIDLALAGCASRARYFPPDQVRERAAALRDLLSQYSHVPARIFWYERAANEYRALEKWP